MKTQAALFSVLALSTLVAACNQPAETPAPTKTETTPAASAAPSPAATTDWSSLDALVGKYPNDSKLIEDSAVTAELKTLLGDRFETFRTNIQTQSPLQRDGQVLYVSGNKPHQGGSDAAYLLIDPTKKALEVGLWEGGKLTTYKTAGADLAKPADIRTLIDNAAPRG
ncbi:hypothetical protein [Brevundimonas faecalis]|uniref:DUF4174 domain-containing protein n=1 Tax=Brevundimonas faecalis TaxID=947378 RepID=A0ABV2RBI1_9CAUL